MRYTCDSKSTLKYRFVSIVVSLLLIICACFLFQWQPIANKESTLNPQHCPYYITLQSLLTSYPLLANDQANALLIKNRLLQFENDLELKAKTTVISLSYSQKYYSLLNALHLTTIQSVTANKLILSVAEQAYPLIDAFYLDKKLYCTSPLYNWDPKEISHNERVLRHNLSGLYKNIPDRYLTIVSAISDDWLAGPVAGFFINNQTTTMDTRFMTGMPLLTALYVLPKFNFDQFNNYASPAPWNYLRAHSFSDPMTRKLLNIGGIDVFTVANDDLGHDILPDTTFLPAKVHDVFTADFKSFINTQSYGLAYLANNIYYENPEQINGYETSIKKYFAKREDPVLFGHIRDQLYNKLLKLKYKHDIILEANTPNAVVTKPLLRHQDNVKILGIAGERANFIADCPRDHCVFVFNIAKSPGWHAYVNNHEVTINRANLAFMAVSIPQGVSHIWFIYEPNSHVLGDLISLGCLIVLLLFSANINRLNR